MATLVEHFTSLTCSATPLTEPMVKELLQDAWVSCTDHQLTLELMSIMQEKPEDSKKTKLIIRKSHSNRLNLFWPLLSHEQTHTAGVSTTASGFEFGSEASQGPGRDPLAWPLCLSRVTRSTMAC